MIIKKKFDLIQGVDNILNLSVPELRSSEIENGQRKIYVVLELMKNKIGHYTKDRIFKLISSLKARENLHIVNLPNYTLPVSYDTNSKGMIINLSYFGVDDITATKPGPIDVYASLVYAITFSDLVQKKIKIPDSYAGIFSLFIHSILMRGFAKEYGLLGSFVSQIPVLKFLTNIYVLASFFGITGITNYKRSTIGSGVDYKSYKDKLDGYDFTNINYYIQALSDFEVFPNINRHLFTSRILNAFTFNFLPGLEDCSRFISILTTAEMKGTSIAPTYISKYNEKAFFNTLEISKKIFKK